MDNKLTLRKEREFESDTNASLTLMPLSLFPIYLSLRYVTVSSSEGQFFALLWRECPHNL